MVSTCARCGDPATGACTRCGKPYCTRHGGGRSSWDDSGCCNDCGAQGSRSYSLGLAFAAVTALIALAMAFSRW
jgi:hypothetical protein